MKQKMRNFRHSGLMGRVVEFRVVVPLSLEQMHTAEIYMFGLATRERPPEVVKNIRMEQLDYRDTEFGPEISHIFQVSNFKAMAPPMLRWLVPKSISKTCEETWYDYPRERAEMTIPGLKASRFEGSTTTFFIPFESEEALGENPGELSEEELERRQIVWIDIVKAPPCPPFDEHQLSGFACKEAGIRRLKAGKRPMDTKAVPEWVGSYSGAKTLVLRVCRVKARLFGAGGPFQQMIIQMTDVNVLASCRGCVASAPEWVKLNEREVRKFLSDVLGPATSRTEGEGEEEVEGEGEEEAEGEGEGEVEEDEADAE
jgi:hypothetical protein